MFFLLASAFVATLILWPYRTLLYNYNKARKFNLPILITPIKAKSRPHSMLGNFGGKTSALLRSLPFGIFNFLNYTGFEFFWVNGHNLHSKYGPAFVVVSPGEVHLVVADPETAQDILVRRKDFIKDESGGAIDIFGRSVFTLNGPDWQRHRRITTTPFNEKVSTSVWKESLVQAKSMLRTWSMKGTEGVRTTNQDTITLALHVLTATGFGKSYDFDAGVQDVPRGHNISYRKSLRLIITNLWSTVMVAHPPIPEWIMPASWLEVKNATAEYRKYMVEILHEERTLNSKDKRENLLGAFSRASDAKKEREGLSDSEIFGNLFIYTVAGHDTTANTLAYAVLVLAIHPKWQEWMREEIREVLGVKSGVENWDYEKEYPRLKRCLAVMYETLRLYGKAPAIPRWTDNVDTTLRIDGTDYTIPPRTVVTVNSIALSTDPVYWGYDSFVWRPDGFIRKGGSSDLEREEFLPPRTGTYQYWSTGPRVCPGKKFSQVEFVAVIACLLQRHRVVPVLEDGETVEKARKRIRNVIYDSGITGPTLKMKHSERARVKWEEVA